MTSRELRANFCSRGRVAYPERDLAASSFWERLLSTDTSERAGTGAACQHDKHKFRIGHSHMSSFGPPKTNSFGARQQLPLLHTEHNAKSRFPGGERRRKRLQALKDAAISRSLPTVADKPRDQGVAAGSEDSIQEAGGQCTEPCATEQPRLESSPSEQARREEPALPLDWKVLAACEVVLDRESEHSRRQRHHNALQRMRCDLDAQLNDNKARRARERREQQEWRNTVRAQAQQEAEREQHEAQQLCAKRLHDRQIFAKQAVEQRESLEAAKVVHAAEERAAIEAAQRSLESEEKRQRMAREERKRQQVALKKAIDEERKLKEERRRAQWLEEERIQRECVERATEMERRRAASLAQREAMIKKRQRTHEVSTGKLKLEEEQKELELNQRYWAEKAQADEAREHAKLEARNQLNREVLRENASQLAKRDVERKAAARANQDETQRMLAAAEEVRREEQRCKRERLEKQRQFQSTLDKQTALVRKQRALASVSMTQAEQALNKGLVLKVVEKPERKKELIGLIYPKDSASR